MAPLVAHQTSGAEVLGSYPQHPPTQPDKLQDHCLINNVENLRVEREPTPTPEAKRSKKHSLAVCK